MLGLESFVLFPVVLRCRYPSSEYRSVSRKLRVNEAFQNYVPGNIVGTILVRNYLIQFIGMATGQYCGYNFGT